MRVLGENGSPDPYDTANRLGRHQRLVALMIILALMTVGLAGVIVFAVTERNRDLRLTQERLDIVADERLAAVRSWMDDAPAEVHLGPARAVDLMKLIRGRPTAWSSERTTLIRTREDWIRILSAKEEARVVSNPGPDGRGIGSVESRALAAPGTSHEGLDHSGRRVIAVSRPLPDTPWVLVHSVDRSEAMAAGTTRWRVLIAAMTVYLVAIGMALVAAWRFCSSERVRRAADMLRRTADRHQSLSIFMDTVLNAQPNPVFVSEPDGPITFVNRAAADLVGQSRADMPGRFVTRVLGEDKGAAFDAIGRAVLDTGKPRSDTLVFADEHGAEQVWRTHALPLDSLPGEPQRVLTTVEDLSTLVRERRRRERNTDRLIDALVGLVDERDPDSANQSRDVALTARIIAEHMGLDPSMVETTHQAARLVNIGKIRVPRALLTKTGPLTAEEMAQVRAAMDSGPEILRDIEFEGPVLETLRQINEWVDGSGRPRGLSGAEILPTAQATALANSFVALVSPRAFRPGLTLAEVEQALQADSGRRFDPRAVAALRAALNEPGARAVWTFMRPST
ncbi:HD-GYP domain-containing protein [Roseospira visakhapatnamensis]|uniref:PAS domain S-box-containing protein n=1 Tax=Roseospira visakhapatnamensis TaxID=390880 RepID=A0A7W6WA47_9PROT|nr:HD domain-containing phosphohydrolase [Roseospira visakhapatnamensis]MBB4266825.1 PAS domain S-box-containing protein [Roseospira visakhapatnamensis]